MSICTRRGLPLSREPLQRAKTIVLIVVNNSFDLVGRRVSDVLYLELDSRGSDAFKRISRETIAPRHSALARQKEKISLFLSRYGILPSLYFTA